MKLDDIFDFYKDSTEEKVAKFKNFLEGIYNKDIYVDLNILDPRVNHFTCYGDVEDFSKLVSLFPNAVVENDNISVPGKIGFTFYKVADDKRQELIDYNQKAFKEQENRNQGTIF